MARTDPQVTDGEQYAGRVRAARAYANASQLEMAHLLDMSLTTYKRLESGARAPSLDEQVLIASHCEVPLSFLQFGWSVVGSADAKRELLLTGLMRVREIADAVLAAEQQPPEAPARRRPSSAPAGAPRRSDARRNAKSKQP
jgi:transcriptional regulator with XRE-family HTH domain